MKLQNSQTNFRAVNTFKQISTYIHGGSAQMLRASDIAPQGQSTENTVSIFNRLRTGTVYSYSDMDNLYK